MENEKVEPQLQIGRAEASLLQLGHNYNQAVIADVHAFLAGMNEAGDDAEKKAMFVQGMVSTRSRDRNFAGMLIATSAPMMSQEEAALLTTIMETMYARVIGKIAYDIATSAANLNLTDPSPGVFTGNTQIGSTDTEVQ